MAAHQIEARLGSEKSSALPLFRALARCDTIVSVCWTWQETLHGLCGIHSRNLLIHCWS